MNDLIELAGKHQDAVFLTAFAGLCVVVLAIIFRRLGQPCSDDPKVMLQHIRWELRAARDEFSKYPATREIQEIVEGLGSCEATIDRVVARL